MKLYKTTYLTDVIGVDGRRISKISWQTSGDAASKARTALKAKLAEPRPETLPVDIDTKKEGLVAFLNALTN